MEYLLLANNKLSGTLSDRIGQLTRLRWLALEQNEFSGDLPEDGLKKLQSLEVVSLEHNKLEGTVPKELCDAPSLVDLSADCLKPKELVSCSCCTKCCDKEQCEAQ